MRRFSLGARLGRYCRIDRRCRVHRSPTGRFDLDDGTVGSSWSGAQAGQFSNLRHSHERLAMLFTILERKIAHQIRKESTLKM
jgi:hypothetical protein